jgi:hypothetical protein
LGRPGRIRCQEADHAGNPLGSAHPGQGRALGQSLSFGEEVLPRHSPPGIANPSAGPRASPGGLRGPAGPGHPHHPPWTTSCPARRSFCARRSCRWTTAAMRRLPWAAHSPCRGRRPGAGPPHFAFATEAARSESRRSTAANCASGRASG